MFLSFTVQDIPLTNMLAPGAFLVRRRDQSERSPKSKNETNELAHRGHSRGSHLQTSIAEDQLQQRRVHQLRRKLSEHFSGLAVFLGWRAEMKIVNRVPRCREWTAAVQFDGEKLDKITRGACACNDDKVISDGYRRHGSQESATSS